MFYPHFSFQKKEEINRNRKATPRSFFSTPFSAVGSKQTLINKIIPIAKNIASAIYDTLLKINYNKLVPHKRKFPKLQKNSRFGKKYKDFGKLGKVNFQLGTLISFSLFLRSRKSEYSDKVTEKRDKVIRCFCPT